LPRTADDQQPSKAARISPTLCLTPAPRPLATTSTCASAVAVTRHARGKGMLTRLWPSVFAAAMIATMSNGQAWAACEPKEGPRFTAETADRFLASPKTILGRDTSDYGLTVFVMQFSAARARKLDVFKSILPSADARQQAAIGLGFYRAVSFCRLADGEIATRIDKWVTQSSTRDVILAYRQAAFLNDDSAVGTPVQMAAPVIEDRFGDGLNLIPRPSATGVGSLAIPDPTSLPGD
jgi:hypothetical protein